MALTVQAHAKLNLWLRVGPRGEDGYHPIDSLVTSLDLADTLVFERREDEVVSLRVDGLCDAVPSGEDNLVVLAAEALFSLVGERHGVDVLLTKRIPAGAGLGGGSADAAATLRGLRSLLDLDVSDEDLHRLGAGLGADVPFCLVGGAARVRGRGEQVEPLPPLSGFVVLLAVPPIRLSTADVYAAFDEVGAGGTEPIDPSTLPPALASSPGGEPLVNELEPAALRVAPTMAEWREMVTRMTGRRPLMTGSGSGWAVLRETADRAAEKAVAEFRAAGMTARLSRPC